MTQIDRYEESLDIVNRAISKVENKPASKDKMKDSPLKVLKYFFSASKGKPNFYFYRRVLKSH